MLEMERAVQPVRSGSRSSDPSVLQAELHKSSPKCQAVLEALAAAARLCPGSLLAPKWRGGEFLLFLGHFFSLCWAAIVLRSRPPLGLVLSSSSPWKVQHLILIVETYRFVFWTGCKGSVLKLVTLRNKVWNSTHWRDKSAQLSLPQSCGLAPCSAYLKNKKLCQYWLKALRFLTGQQMDCSPIKVSCAGFTEHSCRSWDIL